MTSIKAAHGFMSVKGILYLTLLYIRVIAPSSGRLAHDRL